MMHDEKKIDLFCDNAANREVWKKLLADHLGERCEYTSSKHVTRDTHNWLEENADQPLFKSLSLKDVRARKTLGAIGKTQSFFMPEKLNADRASLLVNALRDLDDSKKILSNIIVELMIKNIQATFQHSKMMKYEFSDLHRALAKNMLACHPDFIIQVKEQLERDPQQPRRLTIKQLLSDLVITKAQMTYLESLVGKTNQQTTPQKLSPFQSL